MYIILKHCHKLLFCYKIGVCNVIDAVRLIVISILDIMMRQTYGIKRSRQKLMLLIERLGKKIHVLPPALFYIKRKNKEKKGKNCLTFPGCLWNGNRLCGRRQTNYYSLDVDIDVEEMKNIDHSVVDQVTPGSNGARLILLISEPS